MNFYRTRRPGRYSICAALAAAGAAAVARFAGQDPAVRR